MLSKSYRLRENEIKKIISRGKRFYGSVLTIRFFFAPVSGFAIVVSNKVSKKAVIRNRIRRQISEIVRLTMLPKLKNKIKAVIIVKTKNVTFKILKNNCEQFLREANLI